MAEGVPGFVWYDLSTTDIAAASAFYGKVLGWSAADAAMPDRSYTLFTVDGAPVGGGMTIPEEERGSGRRPVWLTHIGVDNLHSYVERVRAAGGQIHREPSDIPNVGQFAVAADPGGAVFLLLQSNVPAASGTPDAAMTPGRAGWHELHAEDVGKALHFYTSVFGWQEGEAMDMGPAGVYQMFATGAQPVGGMVAKAAQIPAPFWLVYFNVRGVEEAMARTRGGGGAVYFGPQPVPGGSFIALCSDPQGAPFAVVGPKQEPALQ